MSSRCHCATVCGEGLRVYKLGGGGGNCLCVRLLSHTDLDTGGCIISSLKTVTRYLDPDVSLAAQSAVAVHGTSYILDPRLHKYECEFPQAPLFSVRFSSGLRV